MKKLTLQLIASLLLAITGSMALPGCSSTTKLNTEAPAASASPVPAYQPSLSSITIPVSVSVATIEEKLNKEIAGILYKDDKLDGDNVAVTVSKNGKLSMRADKDKIYFSIPLHIYAKGRWKWDPCKLCPAIDKTEDTSFDMVIKTESRIGLTEDYKINTITSGDFEWGNTKPTIQLGPLKIGLARFVEPAIRHQMSNISRQLDKELQQYLDMRKYVSEAWLMVQQPVKLDNNLDAWLSIVPQDVRIAPLLLKNGTLSTRIGITSFISVTTDGKPQQAPNKKLPKLIIDSRFSDEIQIGLTANIPYEHASKLLQAQVAGQTYKLDDDKSQFTVNNASITPGGDQLILMLDVNGRTKAGLFTKKIAGKVYLRGTPYYDAQSASIKVRNLDYDLDTKDRLLHTASWFAKGKLLDIMQAQVNIPVQNQLTEAQKMLQTTLDQSARVHESVLLRGNIRELSPDNIYLTPTGIKAVVNAKGTLTATVDKL
ncbi:DUF4403 family protein [Pontibacter beigongshangensis]|uniref:DUF4403 family protein n=1 Tax=Pontibacter beigongshangensis TaxID=2574733 RepID=UPI00293B9CBC|nr:DUF4403 family protein [Pontibacter beigongshangensis]